MTTTKKPYTPILALDFDGVIHGYQSGWKGAATIPDPPVPGAIEFILAALPRFQIAIHSSRSHQWGGKRAMQRWIKAELIKWMDRKTDNYTDRTETAAAFKLAQFSPGMDKREIEVEDWADDIIKQIAWPWFKPPAHLSIDDRAWTFTGRWPDLDDIAAFKPWNKQPPTSTPNGDHAQLMRFYRADSTDELIAAMERHIERLQAKLPPIQDQFPVSYRQG